MFPVAHGQISAQVGTRRPSFARLRSRIRTKLPMHALRQRRRCPRARTRIFRPSPRTSRPPRCTDTGCSAVVSSTRHGLDTDAPALPYGLDSSAKRYSLRPCALPQSVAGVASSRRSRREMEREPARTAPGQPRSLVSAQRTRVRCCISADANGRWVVMICRDDARIAADLGGVGAGLQRRRVRGTMQPLLM